MTDHPYTATARSQLARLATLTDVVYAVGLVLIVSWLPLPEESHATGAIWIAELWAEYSTNIVAVIIGLVFSIMYWLRSNTLMTALDRTDGIHTGLTIASVFFLLLLLYVVRVSEQVAAPSRRAGESIAVALIGLAAGAVWLLDDKARLAPPQSVLNLHAPHRPFSRGRRFFRAAISGSVSSGHTCENGRESTLPKLWWLQNWLACTSPVGPMQPMPTPEE